MKTVLLCQHERGDDLRGWKPLFANRGVRLRRADFSARPGLRPDLEGVDGLLLLGGSMDVHEAARRPHLSREMGLIRAAANRRLPVLGVCLGGQLVSAALGGKVTKSAAPEIGWRRLSAASGDDLGLSGAWVFQWHAYQFSLPRGAERLASSAACRNQAFRLGDSILATQFHFEIDRPTIEAWLKTFSNLRAAEEAIVRRDTTLRLAESRRLGAGIFRSFLEQLRRS